MKLKFFFFISKRFFWVYQLPSKPCISLKEWDIGIEISSDVAGYPVSGFWSAGYLVSGQIKYLQFVVIAIETKIFTVTFKFLKYLQVILNIREDSKRKVSI